MLAKDPQGRYENARELLHDLRMLQVAGDEAWEDIDELPTEEREALATVGLATQHLAAVMKTSSMPVIRRRFYVVVALGTVLAFAAGGLVAWETQRPLLAATGREKNIRKYADAGEQYMFASLAPTNREAWLKSVSKYFPRDREFVPKAKQELALYYLQMDRQWEALILFEELAASPEPEQQAFGLAGASLVRVRRGEYQKALEDLMELWPLRKNLVDARMAPLVQMALDEVRKQRGQAVAAEWGDWQKSLQTMDAEN